VNLIHRFLLVWLLLLALPFQGIASASMLARAPSMTLQVPAAAHAAMASSMDVHDGHCAGALQQADPRQDAPQPGAHHGGKAGSCADCCAGATMAPAVLPALVLAPPHFISIPFRAGHVPSVDPALPERPPRTILA
jgi:hypothetical protein